MNFGDYLLRAASSSSPLIGETLRRFGDRPLKHFLGSIVVNPVPSLQDRHDLWTAIEVEAVTHYGPDISATVVTALRSDPIVPTSNHFGIDTRADSVQGTLLFSLRPERARCSPSIVVLGFGSISMNNFSYPMGLQLYDPQHGQLGRLPQRLPVFPNRMKQRAVCAVSPFDEAMVRRAQVRLRRMALVGEITPFCARAAEEILEEVFAAPSTLAQATYSGQAIAINTELWRRMFRHRSPVSELVLLQVEPICTALLRHDLYEPASLIHRLFFEDEVRKRLLTMLDGARACWHLAELRRRLHEATPNALRRSGTVFFWGLSESGCRVPLTLVTRGSSLELVGIDDGDRTWGTDFSADGIVAGLESGRLLPSLFTCFTVLAFARGLTCVGGYYQAEYLPIMQAGIVNALAVTTEHRKAAELVAQVPSSVCLALLQGLVRELDDGSVVPAGPVELAGIGGVDQAELAAIEAISVQEAYLLAFAELFDKLVPVAYLPDDWIRRLAVENGKRRRRRLCK